MAQPINGVWWTLPVELGFYLLLPFLGLIARWVNWVALLAAAVLVTVGWRAFWFALQRRGDLPLNFTRPRFIAWSFADIHLGIQPEFFDAIFGPFLGAVGA